MITFKDLVNHPFSFAIGVGVANGLLAVGRGKSIDKPTAITLSLILGLGEMALVAFEPESERPMSLTAIGLWSVAGVAVGVMPFIKEHKVLVPESAPSSSLPSLPIAVNAGGGSTAVSGWSRNGSRRRAVVPRRRRRS
jgi:predicted MFS family arabinose efflux permease